ncbi:MAG TPA: mechanosensitive ion channel protein MscS [Xanthomonadaceae bacterium]|nr:mechanosensitive ion channel protein MscS [Xanthomonadaceae bacterium]
MIRDLLPRWNQRLLDVLVPTVEIALIVLAAIVVRLVLRQLLRKLGEHYHVPMEMMIGIRRIGSFVVSVVAVLLILSRLGVSPAVLWTAFTGFAAVGAVAFFAAWSVLSNIFCTFLIVTTRPFRLHDHIELLENGEKPGLKGKVIDINVIYTTLQETGEHAEGTVLQIPNSLFFQRTTRRWRDSGLGGG